jgi:VWFA-related protein
MVNPMTRLTRTTRTIPAVAILWLLGGCVFTPAGAQTVRTTHPAQTSSMTTLQAVTRLVYVDVVVRDSQGRIVHGLKQDQFAIKEDRVPERVSLFEEHRTNLEQAASPTLTPSAPETHRISNIPTAQPDSPLDMVLLDMLDTEPVEQAYSRPRMIEFLRKLPPGRRVALFILTNQLHMVQGFTSDSTQLAKAAEAIDIHAMGRVRTPNQMIAEHDQEADIGGLLAKAIEDGLGKQDIQNMKVRLDATRLAFEEISRAVNGIPGRKNLYWLAGQFPSDIYFTLQNVSSNTVAPFAPGVGDAHGGGPGAGNLTASGIAMHPFGERMNQVVGDSQIAVYPIDLVGIQTDVVRAENKGSGSALGAEPDTAATFFNERADDRTVMNHIADETGGEAFYGNNDPAGMLRRGFEDGENYYTLVYQPQNHDWNGAYRKIAVKLNPGGYHLNYRRGFYALPAQPTGKPIVEFASAMKLETPPSTMLTLSAVPPVALSPGVMRLDATVDLHGVGFVADPKAATDDRKARLEVLLIAYPLGGPARAAEINNVLALGLTSEDYTRVLASGIPLRQTLHLVPGNYAIRLGILDTVSGRIGTLTLPFTMPGS